MPTQSGHRDRFYESHCNHNIYRLRYVDHVISNGTVKGKVGTFETALKARKDADPNGAVRAIGAFRAFGGGSFWIAPNLTARAYRSGPEASNRLSARLAAAREIALAIGPLLSQGEDRRRWLRLGFGCDLADVLATIICSRRGDIPPATAALCFITYAVSLLLTGAALHSTDR
jgi:hypothetical protein